MGVEPPFIYDRPSSYTFAGPTSKSFNPRAATQASWTPRPEKPKQDGPLINFNKHPDTVCCLHTHSFPRSSTDNQVVCSRSLWQPECSTDESQNER